MMSGIWGWFLLNGYAGYTGGVIGRVSDSKNYMLTDPAPVYVVLNPINNET